MLLYPLTRRSPDHAIWTIFWNFPGELPRIPIPRLYEKSSQADQPPQHETTHGSIYQRFPARTKPLVIFAHPPVVVDPRKRAFYHPPPRQHLETWRRHELLPIYRYAFFSPLLGPRLHDLFGGSLARALEEIHAPPQHLLDPVFALVLPAVATIQPQMTEAGKLRICLPQ